MSIELKNRRKFARINIDRHVNFKFMNDLYNNGHVYNLSLSGMFVLGQLQKQIGNHCLFNLTKTESFTVLCFQGRAKVIRRDAEGVGIEFTSMPHDSYMFLQMILLYEAEYPFVVDELLPNACPFEVTNLW